MLEESEIILRLVVAAVCAGLIGLERERKSWTAGMRTHMMVGLGSALFMMVSSFGFSDILGQENVELDPSRVASQVVSGIGFLGAGTILFLRRGVVRGLTTASGLWTVAGIGLAVGGGMYVAGIATTIIAIIILWILQPLEEKLFGNNQTSRLQVRLTSESESGQLISEILEMSGTENVAISLEREDSHWNLIIKTKRPALLGRITDLLKTHKAAGDMGIDM